MPNQINTQLEGTFGNMIFYKWKDKYVMREKGKTGNQAPEAKIQAARLGKASALSASIRKALQPFISLPEKRKLMYRLNNALQQWLRSNTDDDQPVNNIPALMGFSLREDQPFFISMQVNRTAGGNLSLEIPAFDSPNPISPLPFNGEVKIEVIAVSCNVNDPADTKMYQVIEEIDYTGIPLPGRKLELPITTFPGRIAVVAIAVNNSVAGFAGAFYN